MEESKTNECWNCGCTKITHPIPTCKEFVEVPKGFDTKESVQPNNTQEMPNQNKVRKHEELFSHRNGYCEHFQNKQEVDYREVDAEIMDFQIHVREVTGGNNFACVDSTKLKRAIEQTIHQEVSKREIAIQDIIDVVIEDALACALLSDKQTYNIIIQNVIKKLEPLSSHPTNNTKETK